MTVISDLLVTSIYMYMHTYNYSVKSQITFSTQKIKLSKRYYEKEAVVSHLRFKILTIFLIIEEQTTTQTTLHVLWSPAFTNKLTFNLSNLIYVVDYLEETQINIDFAFQWYVVLLSIQLQTYPWLNN